MPEAFHGDAHTLTGDAATHQDNASIEPRKSNRPPATGFSNVTTNVSSAIEAHLGQREMAACEFTEERFLGVAKRVGRRVPAR